MPLFTRDSFFSCIAGYLMSDSEQECYGPWYVVTDSSGVLWVGESREEAFTFAAQNRSVAPTVTAWNPMIDGGSSAAVRFEARRTEYEGSTAVVIFQKYVWSRINKLWESCDRVERVPYREKTE